MERIGIESDYHPLPTTSEEEEEEELDVRPYSANDINVHLAPEGSTPRWNHIQDLDKFFQRVYQYHQRNGMLCMVVEDLFQLLQFVFLVFLVLILGAGTNYDAMFGRYSNNTVHKVSLSEVFYPASQWPERIGFVLVLIFIFAALFFTYRFVKFIVHIARYHEISAFYQSALNISSVDLKSMTWHEVQRRLMLVQKEQHLCVHKQELSELDIYHRILRFRNYMVAFVNKDVLPVKFNVPFIGPYVYLSSLQQSILEYILFSCPWAAFENNWHLSKDYKQTHKRKQLASVLEKKLLIVGVLLLLFTPILWLWQVGYFCCRYAEMIRRRPSELSIRRWSNYARLYLRHFNELDHELGTRLNRAHRPASRYINIFISPLFIILAKSISFFSGAVCFLIVTLALIDEDVLQVEHMFLLASVTGVVTTVTLGILPDPYTVYIPEEMLRMTIQHIHYAPDHWLGRAHTEQVRSEFGLLFQYRIVHVLEEILSPILTPLILIFCVRPRALDIVDFLRNFTVEVAGVGDVCSFAQMDIRKYGNPDEWNGENAVATPPKQQQANNLKTELSLVHFHKTNPEWKPVEVMNANFLDNLDLKEREHLMAPQLNMSPGDTAAYSIAMSTATPSMAAGRPGYQSMLYNASGPSSFQQPRFVGGVNTVEGPGSLSSDMACSLITASGFAIPRTQQELDAGVIDIMSSDMRFSTIYLHELRHRRHRPGYGDMDDIRARAAWQHPDTTTLTLPPLATPPPSLPVPPLVHQYPDFPVSSLPGQPASSSAQQPRHTYPPQDVDNEPFTNLPSLAEK